MASKDFFECLPFFFAADVIDRRFRRVEKADDLAWS